MITPRLASHVALAALLAASAALPAFAGLLGAQDRAGLGSANTGEKTPTSQITEPDARGVDAGVTLSIDDGSFESSIGIINAPERTIGAQAYFLNRFTPANEVLPLTIDEVLMLIPVTDPEFSTDVIPGSLFEALVFVDPSGSGDPDNATLASRQAFLVQPDNFRFQRVALSDPVVVRQGDVWVGYTNTVTRQDNLPIYPSSIDLDGGNAGRSWAFFNNQIGNHFDGPLATAERQEIVEGNWLIRARGQTGGLTAVCWSPPDQSARGDALPPPTNSRLCSSVPPLSKESFAGERRATLMGYNVYRSNQPGVQPTEENLFTSTPPTQTNANAGVNESGSFFVVTAVYDTGESAPSNEVSFTPPTITKLKIKTKKNKIKIIAEGVVTPPQVFLDGIPFVDPPKVKKNNTKIVQRGLMLTGQTIEEYMNANDGTARVTLRNANGAAATLEPQ